MLLVGFLFGEIIENTVQYKRHKILARNGGASWNLAAVLTCDIALLLYSSTSNLHNNYNRLWTQVRWIAVDPPD